jgi:hypothetical protein
MTSHKTGIQPHGMSLRWLNYITRGLTWATALVTVGVVIFYTGIQFSDNYYRPTFGQMLLSACGILAFGGICALFFMALTKLTEIWAEIVDSGYHKTELLEALLTRSVIASEEE